MSEIAAKTPKLYMPRPNSAAFAVIVACYFDESHGNTYWTKEAAAGLASKWTTTDIIKKNNKKPGAGSEYYDGWSSVSKTLISTHKLVEVINRKPSEGIMSKMYRLSEAGRERAQMLVDKYVFCSMLSLPSFPCL
jgi:hypothetical protein